METQSANLAAVLILLHPDDNVLVLGHSVEAGQPLLLDGAPVQAATSLGIGHKIARRDIAAGEKISKYGVPIGSATRPIGRGEHVHVHNVQSDYTPTFTLDEEHLYGHGK